MCSCYGELQSWVFSFQGFNPSILRACISLGIQQTKLLPINRSKQNDSDTNKIAFDHLLQAAQLALFHHINYIINQLPVPHQIVSKNTQSNVSLYALFEDSNWLHAVYDLADGLLQYLLALNQLSITDSIPADVQNDICRFSLLCMEVSGFLCFYFNKKMYYRYNFFFYRKLWLLSLFCRYSVCMIVISFNFNSICEKLISGCLRYSILFPKYLIV